MFSLIIPVYNEEGAVEKTVRLAHQVLTSLEAQWEIIVVNDGSTDQTARILERIDLDRVRIVTHKKNLGNGAAIKAGIRHAQGDILGTIDADGTYPVEKIPQLLRVLERSGAAMIVGARDPKCFPLSHRLAKKVLRVIARLMTGQRIPDLNSGLRLFRTELAEQFTPFSPDRFSFHITLTIGAFVRDFPVHFVPIEYGKRVGTSKLSHGMWGIFHFLKFALLIPVIAWKSKLQRHYDAPIRSESLVHSAP